MEMQDHRWTVINTQLRSLEPFLPIGPSVSAWEHHIREWLVLFYRFFFFFKHAFLQIELNKDELTALNYLTRFYVLKGQKIPFRPLPRAFPAS